MVAITYTSLLPGAAAALMNARRRRPTFPGVATTKATPFLTERARGLAGLLCTSANSCRAPRSGALVIQPSDVIRETAPILGRESCRDRTEF